MYTKKTALLLLQPFKAGKQPMGIDDHINYLRATGYRILFKSLFFWSFDWFVVLSINHTYVSGVYGPSLYERDCEVDLLFK